MTWFRTLLRTIGSLAALVAAFGCLVWLQQRMDHEAEPFSLTWGQTVQTELAETTETEPEEEAMESEPTLEVPLEPEEEEPVEEPVAAPRVPLVVVDAGHGGGDGGAVWNGIIEKELALILSRKVRDQLIEKGLRVRMTRSSDEFISLEDRARMANHVKADVFVSVHLNSAGKADFVHGIETYYSDRKTLVAARAVQRALDLPSVVGLIDRRSERLANVIQRHLCQTTGASNRGIKRRDLTVVHGSACPAVLIECGFISNPPEAKRLKQEDYQDKVATGIVRGVTSFLAAQEVDPLRGIEVSKPKDKDLLSQNEEE